MLRDLGQFEPSVKMQVGQDQQVFIRVAPLPWFFTYMPVWCHYGR